MKIIPVAFDSLGTRSMATYIETKDVKLFIDPGVSLAPVRFGLPPHPIEIERMNEHWEQIKKYMEKAEHVCISHYHYDHHDPEHPEIFKGKHVFVKHPTQNINKSQKERAAYFLPKIKEICSLEYAEGKNICVGNTEIKFSRAVPHGPGIRLGYVVETIIDDGREVLVHTSDVEGPALKEQLEPILNNRASIVFLDGPLSYIIYRYGNKNLGNALANMKKMIDAGVKILVYDHHFLRDPKYKERIAEVEDYGKELGCKVQTAAEFRGMKVDALEMRRKELHENMPA